MSWQQKHGALPGVRLNPERVCVVEPRSVSCSSREFLVKNCRQGSGVWWWSAERSLCPAREFRKSLKFPRQGKDFHRTEGTRVQGNLSCSSSSSLPRCSSRCIHN
ncbi:hypothetical protein JOB18_032333 [Solea senegalensis]|uniref:Uncharacterized protein n=1 Tax=Solea senegalensis TaxID=28829 RepID=A0AAV6S069_SOLSE|nr:hypothetical protein JOB18_032333 [Solea senegalensis]